MLLYDTTCLTFNEAIIDTKTIQLFLYTHENGALVLMATLNQPSGNVFFITDDIYLNLFYTNKISLQSIFEASTSIIVTVLEGEVYKLYMCSDADISLCEGEKLFSQFEKNRKKGAL